MGHAALAHNIRQRQVQTSMGKRIVMLIGIIMVAGALILIKSPAKFVAGSEAKTYSLNDAVNAALGANTSLSLITSRISLAQNQYNTATKDVDRTQKNKDIWYYEWQKDEKQKTLKIDVSNTYYQILIKQQQVNIQSRQIDRLLKEYDMKKKQVELGNDVESTLASFNVTIAEARSKLTSLKNDLDKLRMDLNIKMGAEVNQQIILKDESIPAEELKTQNLDQLAQDIIIKSKSVENISRDIDVANAKKSAAEGSAVNDQEDSIVKLRYDLEDQRTSVEYQVYTDYNALLNLKDDVTIKKLDHESFDKKAKAAKLRYELGLLSYLDYNKAQEDADSAVWAYQQARLNYYVSLQKYKNFIS